MANYYLSQGNLRNYVLLVLGTYTALRVSDLLGLRWSQVYDEDKRKFKTSIRLME